MKLEASQQQWVDEIWRKINSKLERETIRNRNKIPYTTNQGVYDDYSKRDICWWTNGFWAGLNWLMYVGSLNEQYLETARKSEIMLDEAFKNFERLHHDVGFMWHISAGVNYTLTGDQVAKTRCLYAASILASRYNLKGKFIRAWNERERVGWAIIDCMMNIPILYWASRETGDDRFRYIAMSHADTTMAHHIRADGSVKHIVAYNVESGEEIDSIDGQGYSKISSWSRGQAWGLYGFTLSYIHTNKQEYLDTAKQIAHYFISCVSEDWLPRCDFRSPTEPIIYDMTAGAIAACGLIELSDIVERYEQPLYLKSALRILDAIEKKACNWNVEEDSILQLGTECYYSSKGKHIPIIYGDYYFVEAIYKLKGFKPLFW